MTSQTAKMPHPPSPPLPQRGSQGNPYSNQGRAFSTIVRYFRTLHAASKDAGAVPYRLTSRGAWAASRAPHVFSFFRRVGLNQYDSFLDLGSGDGIVACIAGLFTRSVGIEIDPGLCRLAQRAARELHLADSVSFICGNYLELPIRRATCLYHYPDKPMDDLARLLTNWDGVFLIYGPHFPLRTMIPVSRLECGRERMVVYRSEPQ
jgi:hypothetical protein